MSKDYREVIINELILSIDLHEESMNNLQEIDPIKYRDDYDYWAVQSQASLAKIYSFRNILKGDDD